MAIDAAGQAWIAGNQPCGLVRFDTNSASFVENVVLPGCAEPVGVSIDVEGHVWVVDKFAEIAFKVDPDDYSIQTVAGFTVPYTYSDMTGAGLDLVVHPPG
jgi:streptogramin lyase